MEKLTDRWPNVAPVGISTAVSLAVALMIAKSHSSLILIGLAVLIVVPVVLGRLERGTQLGLLLLLTVPASQTLGRHQLTVGRLAAVLALVSVAVAAYNGYRPARRSRVDVTVFLIVGFALASWWLGPHYPLRLTVNALTGFAFYVVGRRCDRDTAVKVAWVLLGAGAVGATTVLYEFLVTHKPLFVDQTAYYWNAGENRLFRPGGIFGSPPAAGAVLMMAGLAAIPLLVRTSGAARLLAWACLLACGAAITVTFTRATLIAALAGLLFYAWMTRRLGRTVYVATTVAAVFAIVALPRIEQTHWFQTGVLRQGTFSARTSYWTLAWPLVTDSTQHLLVGHGIDSLFPAGAQLPNVSPQPDIAADPEIIAHGPHNQYIRTLVEEGFVGLALLLGWLVGTVRLGVRAARSGDTFAAGTTAAVTALMVVALVGDHLRNVPTLAVVALLSGVTVQLSQLHAAKASDLTPPESASRTSG